VNECLAHEEVGVGGGGLKSRSMAISVSGPPSDPSTVPITTGSRPTGVPPMMIISKFSGSWTAAFAHFALLAKRGVRGGRREG
jgi:hypothetical protein